MKKIFALLSIAILSMPIYAGAVDCPGAKDANGACVLNSGALAGGVNSLLDIIDSVTNWLFTILLALAILFIIMAAYKYLMSGGGEEVGKAHKMLLYAAVAVAVAVLAKGVVNVVKVITGGGAATTSQTTPPPTGPATGVNTQSGAGHSGNFFEVTGVLINGSPATVEVEYCSDGQKPSVVIGGVKYGDGPSTCNGVAPYVKINGVLSNATSQSGNTSTSSSNVKTFTLLGKTVTVTQCSTGSWPGVILDGQTNNYNSALDKPKNSQVAIGPNGDITAASARTQFCDDAAGTIPDVTVNGVAYYNADGLGNKLRNRQDVANRTGVK